MFSRDHAKSRVAAGILLVLGIASVAHAVDFGDMMNPGKWFGGNKGYDEGPYGPDLPPPGYGGGGPYGYGAPAYGAPGPGYPGPGYGTPGGGYGAPPPGAYGQQMPIAPGYPPQAAPGYAQPPAAVPSSGQDSEARIRELERRIEELESTQRGAQQPRGAAPMPYQQMPQYRTGPQSGMPGTGGTFRPMDQ